MNTTIYYFSSTGNSQDIAKVVANKLNAELLPMASCFNQECSSERIGFIFPTYFWGLPHLVENFIRTLKISSTSPYIFGFMLAKASGGGLGSLNQLLQEKGYRLNYGETIHSVSNYIVEYNIVEFAIPKVIEKAREQAISFSDNVLLQKINNRKKIPILTNWFHGIYLKRYMQGDKNFQVTSNCVGCGMCENICPAKNIILKDGKPTFKHQCEHCIACLHWCPKHAIQYGKKTVKHYHYHHPDIQMNELNK